jgi:hypothetical protein
MRNRLSKTIVSCTLAVLLLATFASAQAPAQGGAPGGGPPAGGGGGRGQQAPLASPNPIYNTIRIEIDVNKSAAEVWARTGKFCDIGEWLQANCMMLSGKEGDVGSVRSIGNEIMVAKTDLSYTYTQPPRVGQFYNLYHGTVEAKPVTATTSKIIYTLVWDNSNLADDAARETDKTNRSTTFTRAIQNMKTLAEGGTLPPRGGGQRRGQ